MTSPKAGLHINDTFVRRALPDQFAVCEFLLECTIYDYVAISNEELSIFLRSVNAINKDLLLLYS